MRISSLSLMRYDSDNRMYRSRMEVVVEGAVYGAEEVVHARAVQLSQIEVDYMAEGALRSLRSKIVQEIETRLLRGLR